MKTEIKLRTPQLLVMSALVISSFSLAAYANQAELTPIPQAETTNGLYQQQNIPQQKVANYAVQNLQNRDDNPQSIHRINYQQKDDDVLEKVVIVTLLTLTGGYFLLDLWVRSAI